VRKPFSSLATSLLIVALSVTPAFAHSTVVSMNPAQDSIQTVAPTQVVITFAEKISPSGEGLTVTAPDGTRVDVGEATVSGTELSVKLGAIKSNGHYIVNYRVVSADGHPVEASAGFEVLIASLVSTATPLVAVTGEGQSGIDKREGLAERESNYEVAIFVALGVVVAALFAFWWFKRRKRTS
jgi:methionine-rich copper-binding protein CopC